MYWDWVADSSAPAQSAVWDPVTGFGGNGTGTGDNNGRAPRVTDGPFKDYQPLYWSSEVSPHGLSRSWVQGIPGNPDQMDLHAHRYTPASMALVLAETTYAGFGGQLENGPHSAVHFGVGGGGPGNGPPGDLGWNDASPNGMSCFWGLWRSLKKIKNSGGVLISAFNRPHLLPTSHPSRPCVVAVAAGRPQHEDICVRGHAQSPGREPGRGDFGRSFAHGRPGPCRCCARIHACEQPQLVLYLLGGCGGGLVCAGFLFLFFTCLTAHGSCW
jgi:hypothetical protein